jgi:hypothetical protein
MVRFKSNVKYYAKQIKHIVMRKDVVYLGMIRCSDIMSLNTSDEGYNNGKKYGQKGAICGPNTRFGVPLQLVSDHVKNFENVVFVELSTKLGFTHEFSSPY